MFDNLKKYDIVLASNSPRRKELLQRLGIPFKVRTLLGVDESYPASLHGEGVALHISRKKAEAYRSSMGKNELLIAADTIVCYDNRIIGKPSSIEDAKEMLKMLSGHRHLVVTGVAIVTAEKTDNFTVTTEVKFANLSDEEINYYVDNFIPLDKAGAYGIQEWIGLVAVEEISGSFFNVMGLPIQRLYTALKAF